MDRNNFLYPAAPFESALISLHKVGSFWVVLPVVLCKKEVKRVAEKGVFVISQSAEFALFLFKLDSEGKV